MNNLQTRDTVKVNNTKAVSSQYVLFAQHVGIANILKVLAGLIFCFFIYSKYTYSYQEEVESKQYLDTPKVDDIYFLDFRKLSDNLRPKEKYRIAKVIDITGDVVTMLYSNMFFPLQKSAEESIRYGLLRYKKYFEPKRYDFTSEQLRSMQNNGAIYLIKRPDKNMLYGNYINEPKSEQSSTIYIPGKRENFEGLSLLKSSYLENNLEQAYGRFSGSAKFGYAQGQVNLGQMYLNGQYVDKDLSKAMYWFKQAALQSDKAGVLKYVIVCRQVDYCYESDFYQTLTDAGVNIKVREHNFSLSDQVN